MKSSLESLEEEDITVTFLRQAMIAIRGHLKESDVYEKVQERVKGPQSAVQFLTQLENMAAIYVAVFNPEHERWNTYPDTIRRAIQTLNLLNIKGLRPLMLAVASQLLPKEASDAFRMFISWSVRLIITANTSRGSIDEILGGVANLVFIGDITTAASIKKKASESHPSREEFRKAFETATVSKGQFARYYLRSLEMAAKDEATPWFIPNDDKQVINLEHILPQAPQQDWAHFNEDELRIYTRRIGNLALLLAKSNSSTLANDDFQTKRGVYKKESPYELTRMIAQSAVWTKDEIASRQRSLAELALKAWPL